MAGERADETHLTDGLAPTRVAGGDRCDGAGIEDLPRNQVDLYEFDHTGGWIVFGTNGAGEGYAFDEHGEVLVVPWLGSREDAIPQGCFTEFIRHCAAGTMFER